MLHIPGLDEAQGTADSKRPGGTWPLDLLGRLLVALDVLDTVTKALDTFETLEWHVTFPGEEW